MLFLIIKTSLIISITSVIVRLALLNVYQNQIIATLNNFIIQNTLFLPLFKLAYALRKFCDEQCKIYPIFWISGILIFFSYIVRTLVLLHYAIPFQNLFLIIFGLHGLVRALYSLGSLLKGRILDPSPDPNSGDDQEKKEEKENNQKNQKIILVTTVAGVCIALGVAIRDTIGTYFLDTLTNTSKKVFFEDQINKNTNTISSLVDQLGESNAERRELTKENTELQEENKGLHQEIKLLKQNMQTLSQPPQIDPIQRWSKWNADLENNKHKIPTSTNNSQSTTTDNSQPTTTQSTNLPQ